MEKKVSRQSSTLHALPTFFGKLLPSRDFDSQIIGPPLLCLAQGPNRLVSRARPRRHRIFQDRAHRADNCTYAAARRHPHALSFPFATHAPYPTHPQSHGSHPRTEMSRWLEDGALADCMALVREIARNEGQFVWCVLVEDVSISYRIFYAFSPCMRAGSSGS